MPHHLVGEVPLAQCFDVAQYLAAAQSRIAEIQARGKVPIICGGTGLYLRALSRGLAELPRADAALRAQLEELPIDDLQRQLAQLDPAMVRTIDLKNRRRLVRALEVCLLTGKPFSSFRAEWDEPKDGIRGVVVLRPREELEARIAERTAAMFRAGVEEEVRALGVLGPTAAQTLGLREIRALLAGEINRAECIARIAQATRRYAKRQLTWFRREPQLEPLELNASTEMNAVAERLAQNLR